MFRSDQCVPPPQTNAAIPSLKLSFKQHVPEKNNTILHLLESKENNWRQLKSTVTFLADELVILVVLVVFVMLVVNRIQHVDCVTFSTSSLFNKGVARERERKRQNKENKRSRKTERERGRGKEMKQEEEEKEGEGEMEESERLR